jgi:nitrogen-specific signal transduction histidine kinase
MARSTTAPASGETSVMETPQPHITIVSDPSGPSASASAETDFLATTVHDLRSPLTSISGEVQLARRFIAKDPARAHEALDLALAQVARMDRLLDELGDLSRVTVNPLPPERVVFDLRDVLAGAVARHETGDEPRIAVGLPDESVDVRGEPGKVGRILDNLLDNAVKYSPAGAPIDVSLRVVGTEAHVRVEDRGVGIPADARERLFTPYFRSSRTRDVPGTGLGLNISRRVAQQHGGRLWLENSTEAGSTFSLALPLLVCGSPATGRRSPEWSAVDRRVVVTSHIQLCDGARAERAPQRVVDERIGPGRSNLELDDGRSTRHQRRPDVGVDSTTHRAFGVDTVEDLADEVKG